MTARKDYTVSVNTGLAEDESLVHVPEERRGVVGRKVAAFIDQTHRQEAYAALPLEAPSADIWRKKLCPGCFMSTIVNALVALAKDNNVSLTYVRDHVNTALDDLVKYGITRADYWAQGGEEGSVPPPVEKSHIRTLFENLGAPTGETFENNLNRNLAVHFPESPFAKTISGYAVGSDKDLAFHHETRKTPFKRQPTPIVPPVPNDYSYGLDELHRRQQEAMNIQARQAMDSLDALHDAATGIRPATRSCV